MKRVLNDHGMACNSAIVGKATTIVRTHATAIPIQATYALHLHVLHSRMQ